MSGGQLNANEGDTVTCIFGGKETEGFVVNMEQVLCVSPEMTRTGRLTFELRIEGDNTHFTGFAIFIFGESS